MKKILVGLFVLLLCLGVTGPVTSVRADTLQIVTNSLPQATIGQSYSTQIQVSGGTAPYTWTTVSTTYPSGCCALGLNGNSQPISSPYVTFDTQSGTTVINTYPAGTYSWTLQVKDAVGNTVTKILSLVINPATSTGNLSVSPTSLSFNASNPEGQGLTLSGVSGQWIASINPSGSWLRVNFGAGGATGIIGSTMFDVTIDPTSLMTMSPGTYSGNITINSYDNPVRFAPVTVPVTLTVSPTNNSSLKIVTTNLPAAIIGQPYSSQVQVSGGTSPYTWTVVNTTYPSGCCVLGLNGNSAPLSGSTVIFNTQSASTVQGPAGTYTWTFQVKDATGNTATGNVSLVIESTTVSGLQINTTSIPGGLVGTPYSASISYTYNGIYALNATWTGLPPGIVGQGLVSDPDHVYGLLGNMVNVLLQGTPTKAGSFTAELSMTDQYGATANQYYNIIISTPGSLSITATSLPNAAVGQNYSATIPYTYSGSPCLNATWTGLPAGIIGQGLASNPNNLLGVCGQGNENLTLSGSPTQAGTYTVTLAMTDQGALNVNKTFSMIVGPAGSPTGPVTVSPAPILSPTGSTVNLPNGTVIQIPGNPTVYLVTNGVLQPFTSASQFLAGHSWADIQQVPASQVSPGAISSTPVCMPDGSVVKGSGPTVYILYACKRYGIPSLTIFYHLGLSFKNMVTLNDNDLANYPDGGIQN